MWVDTILNPGKILTGEHLLSLIFLSLIYEFGSFVKYSFSAIQTVEED